MARGQAGRDRDGEGTGLYKMSGFKQAGVIGLVRRGAGEATFAIKNARSPE